MIDSLTYPKTKVPWTTQTGLSALIHEPLFHASKNGFDGPLLLRHLAAAFALRARLGQQAHHRREARIAHHVGQTTLVRGYSHKQGLQKHILEIGKAND